MIKARDTKTIAVMQPYFFPYGGYYRLMAAADVFVILDCVQFPRRGRVHRSALPGFGRWITLPLDPAPRDSCINEMRFAADAPERLRLQLNKLPISMRCDTILRQQVVSLLNAPDGLLVPFLERSLCMVAGALGLACQIVRSSDLSLPASLGGQERIIEIVRKHGGNRYINAPGGRALYDSSVFLRAGIDLDFLTDYRGAYSCLLSALFEADAAELRKDIVAGYTIQQETKETLTNRRCSCGQQKYL
ncbi:WbqC family protein [Affinirhizobium pseudoryzae]|uniref:WbqC family protein n=1 Tax=Allorhizobium pseudoryzae TaxID=379684 RepID=UPI0013EA99BF|nr:WbqC family protein [Allorhizobium pseudoryzae]